MTVAALLTSLRDRGVVLVPERTRLRWWPKDAITPAELKQLRSQKYTLVAWLQAAPVHLCRACRGHHYWRHAVHGNWLCVRCHPPSFPDTVAEECGADPPPCGPADWGTDVEPLVNWFLTVGQHRMPAEPFRLAPWIEITSPPKFRDSILFDISCGPSGPRNRWGAVEEDLRRLKVALDPSNANSEREV